MRKYTLILITLILSGSFGVSALAYDSGCTSLGPYSVTTGQLCYGYGGTTYASVTYPNPAPVVYSGQTFQLGSRGSAVVALQQTLTSAGYSVGVIDGIYGPRTNRAYLLYQSQYPNPYPVPPVYNQAPSITGVNGPQSLSVGQQGTWTVSAVDGSGNYSGNYLSTNNLSYSVNWGDQIQPLYLNNGATAYPVQQNATFTHVYTQAGTYTPVFTVRNSSGQSAQTSLSVVVSGVYNNQLPAIYSLSQTSGRVGTQVVIYGAGFSTNVNNCNGGYGYVCPMYYIAPNTIHFGNNATISNVYSNDGSTLYFTVPYSNDAVCPPNTGCMPTAVVPGSYNVYVTNSYGGSNSIVFTVTN